jgi:hypothetical protein
MLARVRDGVRERYFEHQLVVLLAVLAAPQASQVGDQLPVDRREPAAALHRIERPLHGREVEPGALPGSERALSGPDRHAGRQHRATAHQASQQHLYAVALREAHQAVAKQQRHAGQRVERVLDRREARSGLEHGDVAAGRQPRRSHRAAGPGADDRHTRAAVVREQLRRPQVAAFALLGQHLAHLHARRRRRQLGHHGAGLLALPDRDVTGDAIAGRRAVVGRGHQLAQPAPKIAHIGQRPRREAPGALERAPERSGPRLTQLADQLPELRGLELLGRTPEAQPRVPVQHRQQHQHGGGRGLVVERLQEVFEPLHRELEQAHLLRQLGRHEAPQERARDGTPHRRSQRIREP